MSTEYPTSRLSVGAEVPPSSHIPVSTTLLDLPRRMSSAPTDSLPSEAQASLEFRDTSTDEPLSLYDAAKSGREAFEREIQKVRECLENLHGGMTDEDAPRASIGYGCSASPAASPTEVDIGARPKWSFPGKTGGNSNDISVCSNNRNSNNNNGVGGGASSSKRLLRQLAPVKSSSADSANSRIAPDESAQQKSTLERDKSQTQSCLMRDFAQSQKGASSVDNVGNANRKQRCSDAERRYASKDAESRNLSMCPPASRYRKSSARSKRWSCVKWCGCVLLFLALVVLAGLITGDSIYKEHRVRCAAILRRMMANFCEMSPPPMRLTNNTIAATRRQPFSLALVRELACSRHSEADQREFLAKMTADLLKPEGLDDNLSGDFLDVVRAQALGEEFAIDMRQSWALKLLHITRLALEHSEYGPALEQAYAIGINVSSKSYTTGPESYWAKREIELYHGCAPLSTQRESDSSAVHYPGSPFHLYWVIRLTTYCHNAHTRRLHHVVDTAHDDGHDNNRNTNNNHYDPPHEETFQLIENITSHIDECY